MAESWERDVLKTIQAPVTTGNLRLLRAWQRWEGGATHNDATWNWLNTTRGKQFPSINSVGVRAFPDYRTGVAYTADTLIGGYPSVISALRSGKPYSPKYKASLISDFSKWVSGSRTARPDYGARILGTTVPAPQVPAGGRTEAAVSSIGTRAKLPKNRNEIDLSPIKWILDDGDDFWDLIGTPPEQFPELALPISTPHPMSKPTPETEIPFKGKAFNVPLQWSGTHVTDGLGWGTDTAHDFILPAGTRLNAPEGGKVVYFHPTGAQGGGSMLFQGDSGKKYWFGHIADGVPAGRRLRAGQRFAVVSADHATPHLHADVEG